MTPGATHGWRRTIPQGRLPRQPLLWSLCVRTASARSDADALVAGALRFLDVCVRLHGDAPAGKTYLTIILGD